MSMATTNRTFGFAVILAQCFGMFPVTGITGSDHTHLKFKWLCVRTIYSIIFALSTVNDIIFKIYNMYTSSKLFFGDFVTLLFYICNFVTVLIFIDLGRKWPYLMKKWAQIDDIMSSYGPIPGLGKRLKIITAIVMISAAIEHSLFISFKWKSYPDKNFRENIDAYLINRFGHILNVVPYNFYMGIIIHIFNMFSTFAWNFMDLFIILMSVPLASRFHQIAEKAKLLSDLRVISKLRWQNLREDYTKLCSFCSTIDDVISNIILLSFANNLFVIIVQLFNSLTPENDASLIAKIYFNYSFSFLIIRAIAVALQASAVNTESNKPSITLTTLPADIHNIEIERFLYQLKYESVALTGHKLFQVKKSLLLSVMGAIVTYELILIQFHNQSQMNKLTQTL